MGKKTFEDIKAWQLGDSPPESTVYFGRSKHLRRPNFQFNIAVHPSGEHGAVNKSLIS